MPSNSKQLWAIRSNPTRPNEFATFEKNISEKKALKKFENIFLESSKLIWLRGVTPNCPELLGIARHHFLKLLGIAWDYPILSRRNPLRLFEKNFIFPSFILFIITSDYPTQPESIPQRSHRSFHIIPCNPRYHRTLPYTHDCPTLPRVNPASPAFWIPNSHIANTYIARTN